MDPRPKHGEASTRLKDTTTNENVIGITSGHFEVNTGNRHSTTTHNTTNYYGYTERQYTDPSRPQQRRPSDAAKRDVSESAIHAGQHATNGMNPTAQPSDDPFDATSATQHGFAQARPPHILRPYDDRYLPPWISGPQLLQLRMANDLFREHANTYERDFRTLWDRAAPVYHAAREFIALWDHAAPVDHAAQKFMALWDHAAPVDYAARDFIARRNHAAFMSWQNQHPIGRSSFSPFPLPSEEPRRFPYGQVPVTSDKFLYPDGPSSPERPAVNQKDPSPRRPSPNMRIPSNETTPLIERPQPRESPLRPWYHILWPCFD